MLNVNSIQDRLAGMSLPQLQQYAQLHKDDPYIVAMAMHVSSMKRKMAAAQQGQPTPPQPPVVDQAIAQMAPPPQQAPRALLPEEQGIGALPERSLAKLAGGGIVAFEEGGEVERYAEGDLIGNKAFIDFLQKNNKTVRDFINALPSEQAAIRAQFAGAVQGPPAPNAAPAPAAAAASEAPATSSMYNAGQKVGQTTRGGLNALKNFVSEGLSKGANRFLGTAGLALHSGDLNANEDALLAAMRGQGYNGKPFDPVAAAKLLAQNGMSLPPQFATTPISAAEGESNFLDQQPEAAQTAETVAPKEDVKPTPPMTIADALTQAKTALGGSQPGAAPGIKSLMSQLPAAYDPTTDIAAAKADLKTTLGEEEKFDRAASIAERKKIGEEYYNKAQALIDKEEGKTKSDKEQAGFMALLEAGLGIMGGTSQHALVNIGQGGKAAMANFSSAMKDIRKASRENEKMRLDLERLKAADARGDIDAVDRLEQSVKNRNANIRTALASGLGAINASGISAKGQASNAKLNATVNLLTNQLTNQTQREVAGMQTQAQLAGKIYEANQPPAQAKLFDYLAKNPEAMKIAKDYFGSMYGTRSESALVAKALEIAKNPAQLMLLRKQNPELAGVIENLISQGLGGKMAGTTSGASGASNQWGQASVVQP